MNIQQLRCLVAAAETGSFKRAAERLHTAQSALSRHIANLEQDLGVALFVRTGRGVELSSAGSHAFARATKLLEDFAAFSPAIASSAATSVRWLSIGAHGGLGTRFLSNVVCRLSMKDVHFSLTEGWSEHLEREVSLGEHDLAVVVRRSGFGVERADLESVRLGRDDTVLLDLTGSGQIETDMLAADRVFAQPLVLPPANSLERAAYESWARHHRQSLKVAGEGATAALRIELAAQLRVSCLVQSVGLADQPRSRHWTAYRVKHDEFHQGIEWFAVHRRTNGDEVLQRTVSAIRDEFHALAGRSRGLTGAATRMLCNG